MAGVVKVSVGSNVYEINYTTEQEKKYITMLSSKLNIRLNQTIAETKTRDHSYAIFLTALSLMDDIESVQQVQPQRPSKPVEPDLFTIENQPERPEYTKSQVSSIVTKMIAELSNKMPTFL